MQMKAESKREQIIEVELEKVIANRYQPRTDFVEDDIEELAQSIRSVGLLQPPVLREDAEGFYEIIAGERRVRACKKLGLTTISAIIRPITSYHSAKAALIENVQRVDLNPLEIARSIKSMMEEFSLTQENLAVEIGKKRSTVANYLRLLQLPLRMQEAISSGKITMAHAKVLLSCSGNQKEVLFRAMIEKNLTVREAEEFLYAQGKPKSSKNDKAKSGTEDIFLQDLKKRVGAHLGTQVDIMTDGKKGKLVIDFYSLDDLDRVLDILSFPR